MKSARDDLFAGVDTAALTLAAVATVATVAMTDGAWTWFTTFLGLTLTAMLLALHRWTPPTLNPRSIFHALGFGCVLTLCLMIALARPLQDNFGDVTADHYVWWWVASAAFLGATEWGLSKVLSK